MKEYIKKKPAASSAFAAFALLFLAGFLSSYVVGEDSLYKYSMIAGILFFLILALGQFFAFYLAKQSHSTLFCVLRLVLGVAFIACAALLSLGLGYSFAGGTLPAA